MITEKELNSQKNPTTTAVGVKMGGTSRVSPQVLPEKVLNPSSDTSQEVTQEIEKGYGVEITQKDVQNSEWVEEIKCSILDKMPNCFNFSLIDFWDFCRLVCDYKDKKLEQANLKHKEAISNFAEKIKTWAWRYQKCIGEGTYNNPVTLQYTDTKDLLKEIDKLVENGN